MVSIILQPLACLSFVCCSFLHNFFIVGLVLIKFLCLAPEEVIPAGCASGYMGRRRTDLMPTIPVRDSSSSSITRKPFTKSPGRTYSMSRLDQLAQPRKPRIISDLNSVSEHTPKSNFHSNSSSNKSMSRSMSNLTVTKKLNKSDSRSMHHLSIAPPIPRPRTKNRIATPDSNVTSTEGKYFLLIKQHRNINHIFRGS